MLRKEINIYDATTKFLGVLCSLKKMQQLTFISSNTQKALEVKAILEMPLEWRSLDLQEIQGSPQEVALNKCKTAGQLVMR
jgi:hypothetical protein